MLFCLPSVFAQLHYKSNGNVTDASGRRVKPLEIRLLMEKNIAALTAYNTGRTKKTAGNILMIGGITLSATDIITRYVTDKKYPGALTYVGAAAVIIAIPVKIGFSKKIRNAVDGYNQQLSDNNSAFHIDDLSICTNQNGIELKISF